MKVHIKFICASLLLCLALTFMFLTATGTIQAYQHFEQDHQRIQAGDVTTVSSWMTIPYIARVYHVPEKCFSQSLHIADRWLVEHATLRVIADHYQRPIDRFIRDVQHVILGYRQRKISCSAPTSPAKNVRTQTLSIPMWKGKAQ